MTTQRAVLRFKFLAAALLLGASLGAQAANALNLGGYRVDGVYALDVRGGTAGGISGLEGSAVTCARDRGTLLACPVCPRWPGLPGG